LAGYRDQYEELRNERVSVLALSVDPIEKAKETVEQDDLPYPVAWGLSVPEAAERIGGWWDEKRQIVQPSEFLLGPDRKVLHVTYSSGPIGRIQAADALSLVRFLKSKRR
jgi:peroxiredoxin